MMKKLFLMLAVTFCNWQVEAQDIVVLDSTLVHVDVVLDSSIIDGAWDIEWGPDGHLWISDLEYLLRYDPETEELDSVLYKQGENLLGVEVHPEFPNTPLVFAVVDTGIYYNSSALANLYSYEWNGSELINETLLLSYTHYGEHCGGRVIVTQDDKLLLTTGDYSFGGDPLMGRTLRMNLDGSIPTDNPIPGNYEWTSGHRNPQGLTQLSTGQIYSSEHGQGGNDELNLLTAGGHYGWPAYDGNYCLNVDSCASQTYTYIPAKNLASAPPSGVDFYDHPAIPEFTGSILVATLATASIDAHTLNATRDSIVHYRRYLNAMPNFGRIRDVATAPDGSVYFIGFDRQLTNAIYRVYNPDYVPNGITAPSNDVQLSIYPNPSNGSFTVRSAAEGTFSLHETNGRIVAEGQLNEETNLSNLAKGIYVVRFGNSVEKLVLQ